MAESLANAKLPRWKQMLPADPLLVQTACLLWPSLINTVSAVAAFDRYKRSGQVFVFSNFCPHIASAIFRQARASELRFTDI